MAKYRAEYKHYEVLHPDDDLIPPRFEFKRDRTLTRFCREFIISTKKDIGLMDEKAKEIAEQIAQDCYDNKRRYLPDDRKDLADKPRLVKLEQIFSPRRVKL